MWLNRSLATGLLLLATDLSPYLASTLPSFYLSPYLASTCPLGLLLLAFLLEEHPNSRKNSLRFCHFSRMKRGLYQAAATKTQITRATSVIYYELSFNHPASKLKFRKFHRFPRKQKQEGRHNAKRYRKKLSESQPFYIKIFYLLCILHSQ